VLLPSELGNDVACGLAHLDGRDLSVVMAEEVPDNNLRRELQGRARLQDGRTVWALGADRAMQQRGDPGGEDVEEAAGAVGHLREDAQAGQTGV
jgi:hypothetical protein